MPTVVGYAQVSTDHQSLDQQQDALTAAASQRIFGAGCLMAFRTPGR